GGGWGDRRRQRGLLGRAPVGEATAEEVGPVEPLRRARAPAVGAVLRAPWRQDGLLRPVHRDPALHGGVARRPLEDALVEVLDLERPRRHLLGKPRRAPRLLPR